MTEYTESIRALEEHRQIKNDAALQAAKEACETCTRCALCQTRTNLVYGTGSSTASLLFIGEAPGAKEDETGIPFVGAAGKLLDRYLFAMDIPRSAVYIANILKCRPPHNRDPLPEESAACMDHLRAQVRIIRPRLIVCLGRIAAMQLIKPDFKITREHGLWFEKNGTPMCAIYHPAALLRDPSKREDMYRDFLEIRERLRLMEEID